MAFDPNDGNNVHSGRSRSTNAGATWSSGCCSDNGRVAWSRQSGVIYASAGTYPGPDNYPTQEVLSGRVYRSTDFGATWTQVAEPNHLGVHAWQANAIWVDPVDSNHVIVGGKDLYRTTTAGTNWTQISIGGMAGSVPSGQQAIVSHPGYNGTSNRTVYVVGSGGVHVAADIQAVTTPDTGWASLNNGLSVMPFHSGAGHLGTNGRIIGGTDGSGSLVYAGAGKTWSKFADGNGGDVAIDPGNGNFIYGSELHSRMYRSSTGGPPVAPIFGAAQEPFGPLVGTLAIDPNNPAVAFVGGRALWRSTDVKAGTPTWTRILGSYFTSIPSQTKINDVAVAPGNSNVIWAAHNEGPLRKTIDGTASTPTWTLVDISMSRLLIDRGDPNVVYAGGAQGIWRTIDGGATWNALNTGLGTVRSIERHPLHPGYLYVGTDAGIFASENGGVSWSPASEGPVNTRVTQLFWKNNATLVAATMGRGMYTNGVSITSNVLAVIKGGSGTGFVSGSSGAISCGATCSATYPFPMQVTLTAAPHQGSAFIGWGGACTGSTPTCVATVDQARLVTAKFNAVRTLTVSIGGTGGGGVSSNPSGISCVPTCSASFSIGTVVALTATPNAGSAFAGWTGACSGTGSCQVTMDSARSVGAAFNSTTMHPLSVVLDGSGSGSVTSSPAGINCGSTCSANYSSGTSVTLTPAAAGGSFFAGWSGACTGTGACTVSMTQARSVTAVFTAGTPNKLLTVFKSGAGTGPVTSSPGGITCGSTCSATYPTGTTVTLTATPNSNSVFAGWSGACTGTSTCVVTMDAAKSVTATFGLKNFVLAVAKAGNGTGPVSSNPAGIGCGSGCSAGFQAGTNVTLTATANSNSVFAGWSGACIGTSPSCVVTMNAPKSVTATFTLKSYALTVGKAGGGSGSVTSNPAGVNCGATCSGNFVAGTNVTLTATPDPGSTFMGWSGACSGSATTCAVNMTSAKAVTATFTSPFGSARQPR